MQTVRVALVLTMGLAATVAAADITLVVDPYLRIQTALAADQLDTVAADAGAVAQAATQLGTEAHAIKTTAEELQGARTLSGARAAFGRLSDALIAYADQAKTGLGEGTRVAYCPMVKKWWVQKSDKISNPYSGKAMPTCGEFKKKG